MNKGDKVTVGTWAYAVSTKRVSRSAALMPIGSKGRIERIIDRNTVVVRYNNGLAAPVNSKGYTDRPVM